MLNILESQNVICANMRQGVELADIFRRFGDEYQEKYRISPEQGSVMRDIMQCRTAALGGHRETCSACDAIKISYNSCRNRHCPKCGTLAKLEWLEKQKEQLLPVPYFHVVFTVDHRFNVLMRVNQRAFYNTLFSSASETLHAFGKRYLKGEIGFTAVLHTWGQTLSQHVHLHCLVTGGALRSDGKGWRQAKEAFLFPAEALSASYRDQFCQKITNLRNMGKLTYAGQSAQWKAQAEFEQLIADARERAWQVYIQPPLGEASMVLNYLGRYMNRTAISNHRIEAIEAETVVFKYKDYKADGVEKEMRLSGVEFMRRFLQHILPKRFVRIRHYGLLAPKQRKSKLARCRQLLGYLALKLRKTREQLVQAMFGDDPKRCDMCGEGKWRRRGQIAAHRSRQNWVIALS